MVDQYVETFQLERINIVPDEFVAKSLASNIFMPVPPRLGHANCGTAHFLFHSC